jgi:hypothetical protein
LNAQELIDEINRISDLGKVDPKDLTIEIFMDGIHHHEIKIETHYSFAICLNPVRE